MSENLPKPEDLQPPAPPEASTQEGELTEGQLDQVAGGAWRPTPAGIILMEP